MIWSTIILAAAQTGEAAYAPPAAPTTPSMTYLFLRLAIMTTIGLGACFVLALYARRRWASGPIGPGGGQLVHVSDLVLERRSALHLVGIGTRRVVIATDSTGLKSMKLLNESFNSVIKQAAPTNGEQPELPDDLRERTLHIVRNADRARVGLKPTLGNNQAG